MKCPFLRKLTQGIYICRIYDTKPESCTKFPISRRQAERIGCPGAKQIGVGFAMQLEDQPGPFGKRRHLEYNGVADVAEEKSQSHIVSTTKTC